MASLRQQCRTSRILALFQLLMERGGTRNQGRGTSATAMLTDRGNRCLFKPGMVGQAKIVIATQIEQGVSTKGQPGSRAMLERSELTKEMTTLDIFQASLHNCVCGRVHYVVFSSQLI